MVAVALVGSTVLKGIFDYTGTYLVNHAGFGMITDLRDDLYNAVLRRSAAFFPNTPPERCSRPSSTTSSACSTPCRRCWRSSCSSFSPFFRSLPWWWFWAESWPGCCCCSFQSSFIPRARSARRVRSTTRQGQDKLADIQNILHETITGNRIVKAFNSEKWEIARFRGAARRLFRANLRSVAATAISSPLMDIFGVDRNRSAAELGPRTDQARRDDSRSFRRLHHGRVQPLQSGPQVRPVQQQLSAGPGRIQRDLQVHGHRR